LLSLRGHLGHVNVVFTTRVSEAPEPEKALLANRVISVDGDHVHSLNALCY
jgi:hypothetical protein